MLYLQHPLLWSQQTYTGSHILIKALPQPGSLLTWNLCPIYKFYAMTGTP